MRSEYVFAATKRIGNRFLLCRMASMSARRLHKGSTQATETINMSLKLIGANREPAATIAEEPTVLAEAVVAEG